MSKTFYIKGSFVVLVMNTDEITLFCRICLEEDEKENLIYPCKCTGTNKYVHKRCLNEWRASSDNRDNFDRCEICHHRYICISVIPDNQFVKICRQITNCPILFYLINYIAIISLSYMLIGIDRNLYFTKVNNKIVYFGFSSFIVLMIQIFTII